jgi:hypothetical protein
MEQDNSYPEPKQLRKFTQEPMPFHEFHASDLELVGDNMIRVGIENVEYTYHPTYLRVENNDENIHREEYPEWDDLVLDIWEKSVDIEITEDYICFVMLNNDSIYEAYWVLEEISISNPRLYS